MHRTRDSSSSEDIRLNKVSSNDEAAPIDEETSPSVLDNMLGVPMLGVSPEEQQHHAISNVTNIEVGESAATTAARSSEEMDQCHKSTNHQPTQRY